MELSTKDKFYRARVEINEKVFVEYRLERCKILHAKLYTLFKVQRRGFEKFHF